MRELSMLELVTFVTALGCGLIAGAFFAFSTFVMKALGSLPPADGIAAMQSINVVVINPWFLTPFVGTAVACIVISLASLLRWGDPRAGVLAGGRLALLRGHVSRDDAVQCAAQQRTGLDRAGRPPGGQALGLVSLDLDGLESRADAVGARGLGMPHDRTVDSRVVEKVQRCIAIRGPARGCVGSPGSSDSTGRAVPTRRPLAPVVRLFGPTERLIETKSSGPPEKSRTEIEGRLSYHLHFIRRLL